MSNQAQDSDTQNMEIAKKNCYALNTNSLLLVGGEVAGIQDFIYDIVRKAAAKNLKGRSFYLQLLIDSLVMQLLETLDISREHIIYSSGGGFYLLAPDTDAVKKIREHLLPYPPSSPAIALFKNGQLVHFIERHQIEGRPAQVIAHNLIHAFEEYCN